MGEIPDAGAGRRGAEASAAAWPALGHAAKWVAEAIAVNSSWAGVKASLDFARTRSSGECTPEAVKAAEAEAQDRARRELVDAWAAEFAAEVRLRLAAYTATGAE